MKKLVSLTILSILGVVLYIFYSRSEEQDKYNNILVYTQEDIQKLRESVTLEKLSDWDNLQGLASNLYENVKLVKYRKDRIYYWEKNSERNIRRDLYPSIEEIDYLINENWLWWLGGRLNLYPESCDGEIRPTHFPWNTPTELLKRIKKILTKRPTHFSIDLPFPTETEVTLWAYNAHIRVASQCLLDLRDKDILYPASLGLLKKVRENIAAANKLGEPIQLSNFGTSEEELEKLSRSVPQNFMAGQATPLTAEQPQGNR
ncbi:MAG: hypothetical protein HOE80_01165 [Candidatus Magasanikbacteria bacterium]|jgi:hypothetical protein|nr:hypothetical protein [Candidatus Magasanikbacteria bacterium]MBT4071312.1 hypothetical protein [Candidatus Magasanikbacteria bacterium]